MTVGEKLDGRNNNFDIIRLFASWVVLFSHSFPLLLGTEKIEPLNVLTRGQLTLGSLAVSVFFILSGFLITMSFNRAKSDRQYISARVWRIFPALLVVLMITVFILGPIFTNNSLTAYFSNLSTYTYLPRNLSLLFRQRALPGVFENNIVPFEINGSLWTLWYEVLFYGVILFLGKINKLDKKSLTFMFIIIMLINIVMQFVNENIGFTTIPRLSFVYNHVYLFCYFLSGMLIFVYKDELVLSFKYSLVSFVVLIIFGYFGFFKVALPIFGTYLLFYVSLYLRQILTGITKKGDYSYGIYIYAFPVQQVVVSITRGNINFFANLVVVTSITLILSILSWNLVEKRALKYKSKYAFKK